VPKTKIQDIVFTLMMIPVMVVWMVLYNTALSPQGLAGISAHTLVEILELCLAALVIEVPVVSPIAHRIAFKIIDRTSCRPLFRPAVVGLCMVSMMCPYMSFMAMVLLGKFTADAWLSTWGSMILLNYPMALCWQIFAAGPAVRAAFARLQRRICPEPPV
jgi:hypothetical protein